MPAGPGDRTGVVPAVRRQLEEHLRLTGGHVDLEDAGLGLDFVAAFDDVAVALFIEAAVHGRVEPGRDHLDSEALGNQDVAGAVSACAPTMQMDALGQRLAVDQGA